MWFYGDVDKTAETQVIIILSIIPRNVNIVMLRIRKHKWNGNAKEE